MGGYLSCFPQAAPAAAKICMTPQRAYRRLAEIECSNGFEDVANSKMCTSRLIRQLHVSRLFFALQKAEQKNIRDRDNEESPPDDHHQPPNCKSNATISNISLGDRDRTIVPISFDIGWVGSRGSLHSHGAHGPGPTATGPEKNTSLCSQ